MAKNEVKLLGAWPSPFVIRAKIALNLKSVEYESVEENLANKSQLLLQSNPVHKKVPVLIHGDKSICESMIILEYIDEAWSSGPSIVPSDPYDRAVARFWGAYIDNKLFPAITGIAAAQGEDARKEQINQVAEGVQLFEEAFVKCSKGKDFFSGDKIGFLDIAFGAFLGWLRVIENFNGVKLIDEVKTPNLATWAEKFCADSAVKDAVPDNEKLAEFAKLLFAKLQAGGPPK